MTGKQEGIGSLLVCRLLPANSLNHTPKNSIREVFFYSVGFFSSAGGVLFPTQIFEDQCWRGRARRAGFFLFYFLSPRIRSRRSGPELRRIHLAMIFALC